MQRKRLALWKDTASKSAILGFIDQVTRQGLPGFVAPEDRIAVFDNDGTLWCEKPLPIQADFFLRRMAEQARQDPPLRKRQPWKAAFEKDYAWLSQVISKHYQGDDSDLTLMAGGLLEAFKGATVEEFGSLANDFLRNTDHPLLKRRYFECAFQPMIELLQCLKEAGFTSYIVSAGGRDFVRPIAEDLYGIPMERVIGSSVALEYRDDGEIVRKPQLDIFDEGPAKPVRIWSRIGRRPIFAAGNSNGDLPMLRFCSLASRPFLGLLVDHDDETREFAYRSGAEKALDQAKACHWSVVSMKNDWATVF